LRDHPQCELPRGFRDVRSLAEEGKNRRSPNVAPIYSQNSDFDPSFKILKTKTKPSRILFTGLFFKDFLSL
jgi:3-methyladenine DNA glycosylase AlkC